MSCAMLALSICSPTGSAHGHVMAVVVVACTLLQVVEILREYWTGHCSIIKFVNDNVDGRLGNAG